ncbi:MAG: DNA gyrase subunit B [Nanoarchaeota archaeon]
MSDENKTNYSADKIKAVSGIEHVRLRPAMYIGDIGEKGLHHLVWEILDNAVDEAMAGYANKIKVELLSENVVSIEDNGRGIPVDIHPQLKKPAVEIIFTHLGAGGKFSKDIYKYSGGLHGVGATVVNALSKWTEVIVKRDGKEFKQIYERGKTKTPLQFLREISERNTGTKVTFEPDDEIFETTKFDPAKIEKRVKELAFLNPGVKFIFKDHVHGIEKEFLYKEGIKALVKEISPKELLFEPIYIKGEKDNIILEAAFAYNNSYSETIESFVNNIKTPGHGTHVNAFKTALVKAINKALSGMKVNKELKQGFTYDDLKEGLVLVVSAKVPNPQFEGQTKDKLGNSEVKKIGEKIFYEELLKIFQKKRDITLKIAEKALQAKRAREAAKRAKQLVRRKSFLENLDLPGKLTDCIEKDNKKTELFIVEGDSAGGTAKQARDKRFQAILPLRGKILNVEKSSLKKILENQEVKTLIQAIGTGIKENFNYENRRYGKIIIMTDADVDGSHIRALLLTLFYNLMRPLIEKGHIYIALPPLYRLKKGDEVIYVLDDKEMEKIVRKLLKEKFNLDNEFISNVFEFNELLKGIRVNEEALEAILESKNYNELIENLKKKGIEFKETNNFIEIEGETFSKEELFEEYLFTRLRELYKLIKEKLPLKIEKEEKELNNIFNLYEKLRELALKDYEIQRYKGLGEMNSEQLWETTMDPKTRKIKQITIEDAIEAEKTIKALMGENTKIRKEIIFEEAYKANLDV